METHPISFRPTEAALKAIGNEQRRANNTLNTSDAVIRLIERGAGLPEPVYVVSGASHLVEIESILRVFDKLLRRLDEVKSRLGGPLNPAVYKDPRRRRYVAYWRRLSEELPHHIEKLALRLRHLTDLLQGGLTREEHNALTILQKNLVTWSERPGSEDAVKKAFENCIQLLAKVFGPHSE